MTHSLRFLHTYICRSWIQNNESTLLSIQSCACKLHLNHHFSFPSWKFFLLHSVKEFIPILCDDSSVSLSSVTSWPHKPHVISSNDSVNPARSLPHNNSTERGHWARCLGIWCSEGEKSINIKCHRMDPSILLYYSKCIVESSKGFIVQVSW